jgi:hypothetical protein
MCVLMFVSCALGSQIRQKQTFTSPTSSHCEQRQTDTYDTSGQTDNTDGQRYRLKWANLQTNGLTDREEQTYRQGGTDTQTGRDRHTDREGQTYRQGGTDIQTGRDRHTDRDGQTSRHVRLRKTRGTHFRNSDGKGIPDTLSVEDCTSLASARSASSSLTSAASRMNLHVCMYVMYVMHGMYICGD